MEASEICRGRRIFLVRDYRLAFLLALLVGLLMLLPDDCAIDFRRSTHISLGEVKNKLYYYIFRIVCKVCTALPAYCG